MYFYYMTETSSNILQILGMLWLGNCPKLLLLLSFNISYYVLVISN